MTIFISIWHKINKFINQLSQAGSDLLSECVNEERYNRQERKEDGKPCVTSVTLILFAKTFRQTSLSFKQTFSQKTENINVM